MCICRILSENSKHKKKFKTHAKNFKDSHPDTYTCCLPGEVSLRLSVGPSQCQNEKNTHSPHPVLHPAEEVKKDGSREGEEGGRRRLGGEERDLRFKRGGEGRGS